MDNKRSFARIWYRIVIDYFPCSSLGFQDECTGFFVSSFGVKTIERYAHNVYSLLPHWCIKVRYVFDYDNSAPISELEYSKRVRGWEDLRALLTKDIIQTTVINLFTNSYHLCLRK